MFKLTLICVLIFSLGSCSYLSPSRNPASLVESQNFEEQEVYYNNFVNLVEENLVWRAKAIDLIGDLKSRKILSNSEIVTLHKDGTEKYLKLRKRLYKYVNKMKWVTKDNVVVLFDQEKTQISKKWVTVDDNEYLDGPPQKELKTVIELNLKSKEGQYIATEIKIALAAATILTDNYIIVLNPFERNTKLRRIINTDNIRFKNKLEKITINFHKKVNFDDFTRAKIIFDRLVKKEKRYSVKLDDKNKYLNDLISKCYTFKELQTKGYLQVYRNRFKKIKHIIKDRIKAKEDKATHKLSKFFGNTMGMFQSRHGKLMKLSTKEKSEITTVLKPLDVLLEKTPFRLTDKFIPGHWGHVAIWVGTEAELKSFGVWDKLPEIYKNAKKYYHYRGKTFQELVRNGHYIIEALRPGVQINTFNHFLDIDDLAVVRPIYIEKSVKKQYLIHAFEQIGKDYDFNFDVETDKRIVCSELASVVFNSPEMDWPTKKTLGKVTISPDNVAVKAIGKDRYFKPILIYHKGKKITKELDKNFERLLKGKYKKVTF